MAKKTATVTKTTTEVMEQESQTVTATIAPTAKAVEHCERCTKPLGWRDTGRTLCRNCRTRERDRAVKGVGNFIPAHKWAEVRAERANQRQSQQAAQRGR